MAEVLSIQNLHVSYGPLQVLRGVTLGVLTGDVFGLLGPNGTGKTTLIHTILGLIKPQRGTVRVFGSTNIANNSANIGYLPERQRYHGHVTGREYLSTLGSLSGLRGKHLQDQIAAVLDAMDLRAAADRRLQTYSKGMLQRIGLAQAVLHDPDLLIIDEPTSGLDPQGQAEMVALLQQLRTAGHTILMCTHQLGHVAALCERVGVLVNGQIDEVVRVNDLQARGQSTVIEVRALPPATAQALGAWAPHVQIEQNRVLLYPATDALVADVLRRLLADNVAVHAVLPQADALDRFYQHAVDNNDPSVAPPTAQDTTPIDTLVGDR